MKKIVLVAMLATAVSLTACKTDGNLTGQKSAVVDPGNSPAAGAPAATKPAAQNAAVGQGLHVTGDGALDATVTLKSIDFVTKGIGDIAQAPKNGTYAVLNIVVSVTAGDYAFNPLYFKYQTADASTYTILDGNGTSAGFEPTLSSGELHAGQRSGGKVTFDVPAPHGTVQLTDPLGGIVGQWTV